MSTNICVRHYLLGLLAIASAWLVSETSLAADIPTIESIESPAIQRGSMDRLKIVGANLASAREVVFYRRGVTCQSMEVSSHEELSLQLKVEATCPLGMHAFRLRTDEGFSELRTFLVTPYPVKRIADEKTKVPLGCSVIGQLADGQADRYTVSLNSGERLSIDVEAIRLGIELTDTSVVIRDPVGHVVAQADDSNLYRQDPILSLAARQSGEYTIEVSDAGRNSGQQAYYVMHVSDAPRPLAVFPLAASRQYYRTLVQRRLPRGVESTARVTQPRPNRKRFSVVGYSRRQDFRHSPALSLVSSNQLSRDFC